MTLRTFWPGLVGGVAANRLTGHGPQSGPFFKDRKIHLSLPGCLDKKHPILLVHRRILILRNAHVVWCSLEPSPANNLNIGPPLGHHQKWTFSFHVTILNPKRKLKFMFRVLQ